MFYIFVTFAVVGCCCCCLYCLYSLYSLPATTTIKTIICILCFHCFSFFILSFSLFHSLFLLLLVHFRFIEHLYSFEAISVSNNFSKKKIMFSVFLSNFFSVVSLFCCGFSRNISVHVIFDWL